MEELESPQNNDSHRSSTPGEGWTVPLLDRGSELAANRFIWMGMAMEIYESVNESWKI